MNFKENQSGFKLFAGCSRNQLINDLGLLITQAKFNVNERENKPSGARAKSCSGPRRQGSSRTSPNKQEEDDSRKSPRRNVPAGALSSQASSSGNTGSSSLTPRSGLRRAKSSMGLRFTPGTSEEALPVRIASHWSDTHKEPTSRIQIWQNSSGCLIAQRNPKEKASDPDRLRMERYGLESCPLLLGEENLCLLSLNDNRIRTVDNLRSLTCLVYLDLSRNEIDVISGLDQLGNLRVLMLTHNRITRITGLFYLHRLDVLDLSNNRIREMEGLNHLRFLRLLNLSRNCITTMGDLTGLTSLFDLNLGFNEISTIAQVEDLPNLQKLCLENNVIQRLEDLESALNCSKLSELSLDGCPVTTDPSYKQVLLCSLPLLKSLDGKRILEEDKRSAIAAQRKVEQKKMEMEQHMKQQDARYRAIRRAQTEWENASKGILGARVSSPRLSTSLPQLTPRAGHFLPGFPSGPTVRSQGMRSGEEEEEDEDNDQVRTLQCLEDSDLDRCTTRLPKALSRVETRSSKSSRKVWTKKGKSRMKKSGSSTSIHTSDKDRNSDLPHLVELDNGTLQVYGTSAVVAVLKHTWPQSASVHTIVFYYVMFDHVAHLLHKVKHTFSRIVNVSLQYGNLHCLSQINALAHFYDLETLCVSQEGNSITELKLWKPYAIYRLPSTLSSINNEMITPWQRTQAEEMFRGLSQEIATHLPKYRLSAFIRDSRIQQLFLKDRGCTSNILQKHTDGQLTSENIIKAFLIFNKQIESAPTYQAYAQGMGQEILSNVEAAADKLNKMKRLLPVFLFGLIDSALEDYSEPDKYMKASLKRLVQLRAAKQEPA